MKPLAEPNPNLPVYDPDRRRELEEWQARADAVLDEIRSRNVTSELLTVGVDVQRDRLEFEVESWDAVQLNRIERAFGVRLDGGEAFEDEMRRAAEGAELVDPLPPPLDFGAIYARAEAEFRATTEGRGLRAAEARAFRQVRDSLLAELRDLLGLPLTADQRDVIRERIRALVRP